MKDKGQAGIQGIFLFIIALFVLGIAVYAFSIPISTIWDLNSNAPNYGIARNVIDLWPLILIVGLVVLYFFGRPQQGQPVY